MGNYHRDFGNSSSSDRCWRFEYGAFLMTNPTLGPIRIDHNAIKARAKIVREALDTLSMDTNISIEEHWALGKLLRVASETTLARLGRMLK